ncbi:BrnA antitoxin family protein [Paraburkholderia megapolitana]|uniref:Uncharacterized conserved protein, DUF4415 family n=1 Tax=Paraburkholderia megapolitana TaxID=420953 RepID=A0A1I3SEQ6_9BURK|nr:BrnA antitoxin family protein [Paraburkholderia megapolitana]QDQ85734.1 BrnA antitoxin family protein [Paraburkholderia megapolitana]SFJ57205.1 Uncharacterized conserved protein, DUF4415 family [Paraburkholderia megapolitana]
MNARKSGLQSDLVKVNAKHTGQFDRNEIPELGDEFFQEADEHHAGVLVKRGRGRPAGSNKIQMNLRIDIDVIEAYKAQGEGWQTRMNDALRDWAKSHGMMG